MAYTSKYTGGQIEEKLDEIFASKLQEKAVEIVDNGATEVSADEGFLGLGKVSVKVAIPNEEKTIEITENGTTEVVANNGFLNKVIVNTNVASSGGDTPTPVSSGGDTPTPVSSGAITFRDYDGTPLYSYTKDTFLALAEMPTLPTQKGLICQGWNYSLEDAKAYVEKYGRLDVGATYITDDGKTRFYITIASEGRMEVPLKLKQSVSNGVVVDWGDGSASETFSGTSSTTLKHTYSKVGDYVITFEVLDGTLSFVGSSNFGVFASSMFAYSNMLQKVEIGNGVTSISSNTFNSCYSLASIVIPKGITSISVNAFNYCYSLASIVIPKGITSISSYTFNYCYSLASIVIPKGITSISSNAFNYCASLASIVIPKGITSISSNAFNYCASLASIVIPKGITSISNNAFNYCASLAILDFSNHASVPTLSSTNAFSSVASDLKIVVPDALYDEWIAATNWSDTSVSKYIIKASEFNA